MIWELTFASDDNDDVLHLEVADGILRCCRCFELNPRDRLGFRHICWSAVWTKKDRDRNIWGGGEPHRNLRKLCSVMLTCKLV